VREKESEPFQFTFNGFLKVAFQGSRVTSDAGLILVRELDDRLGLEAIIAEHLSDSRHGLNTQFRVPHLLRQSIYSRLVGYEDLNDAGRLSTDPTFRLIGSRQRWDRSAALTSTLHWFEMELLTREENPVGLVGRRAGFSMRDSTRGGILTECALDGVGGDRSRVVKSEVSANPDAGLLRRLFP
jgi:hypothetical protein